MKKLGGLLILAAAIAGCHDDHDDDVVVWLPEPDPWYITYANGHPIAADLGISETEEEMIDLINDHRVASGQNALVISMGMQDLAVAHAIHMDLHGFVGPVNPEGDGPGDRADLAEVPYVYYDEMTGAGVDDPHDMFDAWARTSLHDLIHDPWMTHIGAGHSDGHWAVDFAER